MVPLLQESDYNDTREAIVEFAEQRFRHYGYRKTNVSEIAADAGMSAGNLYRYFENKEDIAAACALRCMNRLDAQIEPILAATDLTASERLEQYVLVKLRYNHEQAHGSPHISELVETVVGRRPEVVHQKIAVSRDILARIVQDGISRGEFSPVDPDTTADALLTALVFFSTPTFMPLYSLEEMEGKARAVARLMINGLVAAQPLPHPGNS